MEYGWGLDAMSEGKIRFERLLTCRAAFCYCPTLREWMVEIGDVVVVVVVVSIVVEHLYHRQKSVEILEVIYNL